MAFTETVRVVVMILKSEMDWGQTTQWLATHIDTFIETDLRVSAMIMTSAWPSYDLYGLRCAVEWEKPLWKTIWEN